MKYRVWAGLILLLVGGTLVLGQGKKTIREKKIASITVQEYFVKEGMDEPVVESVETYDENGELIEIQEFNKKGEIKKWEKYGYDEEGNLVEEVFLDEKGRITRTEKTIFEDGLRVERQFYDDKGRLYKKKAYLYEYR
ncbi:MAG: hypothetical protein ACWGNV_03420 [Bacteroidales bacterium]